LDQQNVKAVEKTKWPVARQNQRSDVESRENARFAERQSANS